MECGIDAEKVGLDIWQAVDDFKLKTYDGVAAGVKEIGQAVIEISNGLMDCKDITIDIAYLKTMAEVFASPESFEYHVGYNLLVNGIDIKQDIDDAMDNLDHGKWFMFGSKLGQALSLAIMGSPDTLCEDDIATYDIIHGYVHTSTNGMVNEGEIYNNIQGLGDNFINFVHTLTAEEDFEVENKAAASNLVKVYAAALESITSKLLVLPAFKYHGHKIA